MKTYHPYIDRKEISCWNMNGNDKEVDISNQNMG